MTSAKPPRPRLLLLILAFWAFVSLGLPDGLLGVAWPSIRTAFSLPVSALGGLLTASMAGYFVSSVSGGTLVARLGVGRLLLVSSGAMVVALAGYALSPAWGVMLMLGVLAGAGGGAIDAAINAYAAERFSPRLVNWLHACYGVGATIGPIVMTAAVMAADGTGRGWRIGYGVIAASLAVMCVGFALTTGWWNPEPTEPAHAPAPGVRTAATLRVALARPIIWLGMATFGLYTGLEVTAGQWAFTLFTESRGVSPGLAGAWVSIYWGCLTAGRVLFGWVANRFAPVALLRVGLGICLAGAALVWLDPHPALSGIGLGMVGLGFAPVYPLLISTTAARVGTELTAHAIGLQVASATLGAAIVPATAGLLARRLGLEVIGPYHFAGCAALTLLCLTLGSRGHAAGRATSPEPPAN